MLFYGDPCHVVKFDQREMGIVYRAIQSTELKWQKAQLNNSSNPIRRSEIAWLTDKNLLTMLCRMCAKVNRDAGWHINVTDIEPVQFGIYPEGGFYGLNLHYLPPILRAKMLDGLMGIAGSKLDDNSKFKLSYAMLKKSSKLKYFEPCFKHYLNKHVQSKFAEVPAPEWEIATFLPTANFRKRNSKKVYYDSRQMLG